ncbi:MAG: 50S ribosomal protein L10 [Candidatus ainarchaeum sp.]|nr:50S ribosomal protein L10 [Candidatus ainarchaeum sp.]
MSKNVKKEVKKEKKERPAITRKKQAVTDISAKAKEYPTLAVVTLKNLPDDLLQSSRKKLREADGTWVKVSKLAVLKRVLEAAGLKAQAEKINTPSALFLTKHTPYELNSFFRKNRKKVAAKPGQISPFEIVVPAGDTDMPPGPALSELKSAGASVQIKAGKIAITKDSTIAKEGEVITPMKAKALQMLGIHPFEVGVELVFAYDGKYIYGADVLNIDLDTLKPQILDSFRDALNLSINAAYPTEQNMEILLKDAFIQGSNVSINAGIYSSNSMEQLLTLAVRQGVAMSGLNK